MISQGICISATTSVFLLLYFLQSAHTQIVGCEDPDISCPTKDNAAKGGICSVDNGNIGIASFSSNVSTSGPLTWTMTQADSEGGTTMDPYAFRTFFLGYPPAVAFESATSYEGCTMILSNVTSALQLPSGFDDFENFGCPTVLGEACSEALVARIRDQVIEVVNEGFPDYAGFPAQSVCGEVTQRLFRTPLPDSCDIPMPERVFKFGQPSTFTNNSEGWGESYQSQDECTMTTQGSAYAMWNAENEVSYTDFDGAALDSEEIARFRTGTTPVFTVLYNEPWDVRTTGPAEVLTEPEVHLTCLRTRPVDSEEYSSESWRSQVGLSLLGSMVVMLWWVLGN